MISAIFRSRIIRRLFFTLLVTFLAVFSFAQSNSASRTNEQALKSSLDTSLMYPFKFISHSEAEKIVGQPVYLKDSLRKITDGYTRFQFTYRAKLKDSISGKTSSLFFGFEQFVQAAEAKRSYDLIKAQNTKTSTVKDMNDTDREGFLAKDILNDPFIMIRKDRKIYKLRLVSVPGANSSDELQRLAKKIVSAY